MTYRVDVDLNAGVVCGIDAWKRDERSRSSASTTSDTDLRTRNIELSSASIARLVQGDMFDPQEIITRW
jgi:hypothetical protein